MSRTNPAVRATRTAFAAPALTGVVAVVMTALVAMAPALPASGSAPTTRTAPGPDWSAYLNGVSHTSYNAAATTITVANAADLTKAWTFKPGTPPIPALGRALVSSPTVVDGVVYVGANNGTFYALKESTGAVVWQHFVGYVSDNKCGPRGFVSTATVAPDPVTGALTVYVGGPNGYLYAFDAANGDTLWQSVVGLPQGNYFNWSSPAVANGNVYIGVSAQCDRELVRGGLLSFNQHTGAQQAAFYTVGSGQTGGSIWSSPAVAPDGTVFVTTGNGPHANSNLGYSESVIALDGSTLAVEGSWQLPLSEQPNDDSDFGGSPTLFEADLDGSSTPTAMVGACNKNGDYYAWSQDDLPAGPVWQEKIATQQECIAAAAYDGQHLWLGAPAGKVAGSSQPGSIREVDPATGAASWVSVVPGAVFGSPTLDGSGVLGVATYTPGGTNAAYLYDAATGTLLATLSNGDSPEFAQPVFAGRYVFVASLTGGLTAYQAP